jgi:hypothetical protein
MVTLRKSLKIITPLWIAALVSFGLVGTTRIAISPGLAAPVFQVGETETPTATVTLPPPNTATATQPLPGGTYVRPIVVIRSYSADPNPVTPGENFTLRIDIGNVGDTSARNVVINFTPGDFLPRMTGGVVAMDDIAPGNHSEISQPMTASASLSGQTVATLDATVSYNDNFGNPYSEKFTLSIFLNLPRYGGPQPTATPTPTATPSVLQRAQLVITNYETDTVPLQPGANFNLNLQVENMGNIMAKRVIMIVGGGSTISNGTPGPGGVSGASGEFTNFAPLGASNIQTLGDINAGGMVAATQSLIVNVTTNPGAYPMKISFAYVDDQGFAMVDEQVITLLVYTLPNVDINFYRDPGPLFTFQPNMLPIQMNNLGRKSTVFGNLRVSASSGILENNVILIGALEAGGYYTLDAIFIPEIPGPTELTFTVDYTDDFNMARQITRTLIVEVIDIPPPEENFPPDGGEGGFPPPQAEETFWQKIWRFILGLLGLGSGKPQNTPGIDMPEGMPIDGEGQPIGPPIKGP